MRKLLGILVALVLILSFSLVTAVPALAASEVWVDAINCTGSGDGSQSDPFCTITEGIAAVVSDPGSGTVHVLEGTYTENITLVDGVDVIGAGAGVSIIDGNASGRVVTADNITSGTVLDGFTITNGYISGHGGGMVTTNSSSLTVSNCTFSGNTATSWGGGMYNYNSSPTLTNCTFSGNTASQYGGGMFNYYYSSPTLTGCTFPGNTASYGGGGMFNYDNCSPTLTNCTFSGNSATSVMIGGGGMCNYMYSSPTLTNCTFTGNTAGGSGDGMYNYYSSPEVTNCIFWNDSPQEILNSVSTPAVTYCDIQGGYVGGSNIINLDPMFVNPAAGDLHLEFGSPCIDVGDNSVLSLPAIDFEGDPRILDGNCDGNGVVDMGIDEFSIMPSGGSNKDTYRPDQDVRVSADGYPAGVNVEVSVVADYHWDDGDDIPPNTGDTIFAQKTFTTDSNGRIDNKVIWYAPLQAGEYDIAFDVIPNQIYNVPVDMIDDPNHPGFIVSSMVGGDVYPVDKAALLMPWLSLGLLLALAAGGLFLARRRSHR